MKIGFLGMGVMGLPMAKNLVAKSGCEILGYDVVEKQRIALAEAGGTAVSDPMEIYNSCEIILQILPTHAIIRDSVEKAVKFGKPGRIIVDLSSTAPTSFRSSTPWLRTQACSCWIPPSAAATPQPSRELSPS